MLLTCALRAKDHTSSLLLPRLPLRLLHLHLQNLDYSLRVVLFALYRLLQLLKVALDERRLARVV